MAQVEVPHGFRPAPTTRYPPHQTGPDLEAAFFAFHARERHRFPAEPAYLPVFWTAYYGNHDFGRRRLRELQTFLDRALRPDGRYFTVVQHDDGVVNVLPEGVVRFGAGGRGDVAVPLVCDPHPVPDVPRDVLASFMGVDTHPVRRRLREVAAGDERLVVRDAVPGPEGTVAFEALTARSEFALCPRGYGRTSFRLYEAMQMGTIPVYVFDEPWLPFADAVNWRRFCVLVHADELPFLGDILEAIPAAERRRMREALRDAYERFFAAPAACEQILARVARIGASGFERPVEGRTPNERRFRRRWAGAARRALSGGRPAS